MAVLTAAEPITPEQAASAVDEMRAGQLRHAPNPQTENDPVKQAEFEGGFLLGSLQHPLWRLHRPLRLVLSRDDGHVVLEWPEANSIFGYGNNLSSAVVDFRLALVELYEGVVGVPLSDLGPDLVPIRELLQTVIGPISAAEAS